MIYDRIGAFSADECDRIVALGATGDPHPAPVYGAANAQVDTAVRNVVTSYRDRSEDTDWIYDRLDGLFAEAAASLALPVGPIAEEIQILRYGPGCHFSLWHTDAGADVHEARRISVSVELSEPDDYAGGILEIVPDTVGRPRSLPRGAARFFPSRALHRVTLVTSGVRHALVVWTSTQG